MEKALKESNNEKILVRIFSFRGTYKDRKTTIIEYSAQDGTVIYKIISKRLIDRKDPRDGFARNEMVLTRESAELMCSGLLSVISRFHKEIKLVNANHPVNQTIK